MLSGYRLMWMVVMFDLPVVEKAERKFRQGPGASRHSTRRKLPRQDGRSLSNLRAFVR